MNEIEKQLAALVFGDAASSALAPREVRHDSELERIKAIPRRVWTEDDPRLWQLIFQLSAYLRQSWATCTLRAIQAVALAELYFYRRLFGPIPVGGGKTLITFLAPVVFGAQRPILFIPAKLRAKTKRDFEGLEKQGWRAPPTLTIRSWEELSVDYGDEESIGDHGYPLGILDLADPDLLLGDEVHRIKNPHSARAKKMSRFMESRPTTPRVDLSGSITRESIHDYAHIARWNLKSDSPIPRGHKAMCEWANALDAHVPDDERVEVGALLEFATEEERRTLDPLTAARRGFRRRLLETPGVVAFAKEFDGASLFVQEVPTMDTGMYGPQTEEAFKLLRTNSELPSKTPGARGPTTSGGLDNWRHGRSLSRGYFTTWKDPGPPAPWLLARTEYYAAIRQISRWYGGQRGIDSEFQVVERLTRHFYAGDIWNEGRRALAAWRAIKDSFDSEANRETIWIDDGPLNFVADWMRKNTAIVWVESIPFAERLAAMTGRPYYHEGGFCGKMYIEDAKSREGSIIASIDSNNEGRNLQHEWCDNLFVNLPKGAHTCQQVIGRTHREMQRSDEVNVNILILCREDAQAWFDILKESQWIVDGSPLGAKVLHCDRDMPDEEEISARSVRSWRFA